MKFIFSILFLILNPSTSLKTNELCIKKLSCNGKHRFDCGSFCSTSSAACDDIHNLKFYLNKLKSFEIKPMISKMVKNIKACAVFKYEWKSADVCLNTQNCTARKGLAHLLGKATTDFFRHVLCPCNGAHKIQCGKQY